MSFRDGLANERLLSKGMLSATSHKKQDHCLCCGTWHMPWHFLQRNLDEISIYIYIYTPSKKQQPQRIMRGEILSFCERTCWGCIVVFMQAMQPCIVRCGERLSLFQSLSRVRLFGQRIVPASPLPQFGHSFLAVSPQQPVQLRAFPTATSLINYWSWEYLIRMV